MRANGNKEVVMNFYCIKEKAILFQYRKQYLRRATVKKICIIIHLLVITDMVSDLN